MYDPKCRLFLVQTARTKFIRVSWQMANYICCCFLQQQFLTVWGGLVCILAFHLNYCISRQVFLQCVLMPGTRPQMQSVVGADSKKDVRCAQLSEREGYRHFLIAFERSSSIQFEGGSMWIPAFFIILIYIYIYIYIYTKRFLQWSSDARGKTPNAWCCLC